MMVTDDTYYKDISREDSKMSIMSKSTKQGYDVADAEPKDLIFSS
jgi:hypothetical protein